MRTGLIVAALVLAIPANAQSRTFSTAGQITSIYDNSLAPKTGLVGIGDSFQLTIDFDPLKAVRTTNPANGPNYGQYILPLTYHAQIGGFGFSGQFTSGAGNYLSFYNNFNACGPSGPPSCIVDAAYFSQVGFSQTTGPFAVDPGAGLIYGSFDVQFFDSTGTVLSSADLSTLDDLNKFSSVNLTYGLFNATRSSAVYIKAANARFVLSAVPEPFTWTMMIFGFGMVGASMRRRLRTATGRLA